MNAARRGPAGTGWAPLLLGLCLAAAQARAVPRPFRLSRAGSYDDRVLFIDARAKPDPAGWSEPGFDDHAWTEARRFNSQWLPGVMDMPWLSYATDGRSVGGDRMLVRVELDLPRGLFLTRADLELVADDNAEIWVNGRALHREPDTLFVAVQPRRFDLKGAFKPCGNVLGLRVSSFNPVGIGYKYRLSLEGRQDQDIPCEPPTPSPTATASASPSRTPSPRPTPPPTRTPRPTPTPWPTPRPVATDRPAPDPRPSPPPAHRPSATPAPRPAGKAPGPPPVAAPRPAATPTPTPTCASPLPGAPPRVLNEARRVWMGDGGGDALTAAEAAGLRRAKGLALPFVLEREARVWAEAHGIRGLRVHESDPAPEAFLDDQYLGPLLAEHDGRWRSPRVLRLAAGPHRLTLRLAQMQDAADFSLDDYQALSDPLDPCR